MLWSVPTPHNEEKAFLHLSVCIPILKLIILKVLPHIHSQGWKEKRQPEVHFTHVQLLCKYSGNYYVSVMFEKDLK